MKTCLICGATSPANQATCPKCGEASWGTVRVEVRAESLPGAAVAVSVTGVQVAAIEPKDAERAASVEKAVNESLRSPASQPQRHNKHGRR